MKDISIDNTTLSEKIAETIRGYILNGTLKAGDRLTEPKLSEMLGISRTPIREALRLLEMEGFVEIFPRRGAVVSVVTDKDVDDIFVLKMKLESLAAKLAIKNLSFEDIAKLKDINDKMEKYSLTRNVANLIKLNSEFHNLFISKCNNSRLVRFLESLLRQFKRATAYSFTETGRISKVIEEHKEIIDAFEERDADRVEKLVEKHIKNGWNFILNKVSGKVV
jgi:DNA-binding GntR family transcriptional regulator